MPRSPNRSSALVRLADWSYRRRRVMVLLWIAALVGTIVLAQRFGGESAMSFSIPGTESQEAQDLLQARFAARSGDTVDVVFRADAGVDDATVRAEVEALLDRFRRVPHVAGVESPYEQGAGQRVSPAGKIAYATLQLDASATEIPKDDARQLLRVAQEATHPGFRVELSGFAVQGAEDAEFSSEGIGLMVAALILLVSFGSVLAMGLPLMTAIFGLGIASGLIALLANVVEVPDFAPQVAAMIGIGVGIDYVLFILTRYRASLHQGQEPREAVITAMSTAGRAVLFAGCTVVISVLGLLVMNLGFLRGVALGAAASVLVVMLASVTLLPAVLGFVGRTIDRLRVPFVGPASGAHRTTLAFRWSRVVQRSPWPAALACLALLLVLAAPALHMDFGFPDAGNDPAEFTTRQAYDLLTEGFGPGFNGPLFLVAESGQATDVTRALEPVRQRLTATPGVAFVGPPVVSPDGDVALMAVFPKTSPQSAATKNLVNRLRGDVLPEATAGTGVRVLVGGATAGSIDANRYVADRLPLFIGAVIALSFILLLFVFRSLVVPLKAAVMNLLSIGAAYGVVALLVDGGWFGSLFGVREPVPVPSFIPMMMFAILFGLSMDYEVFLLSRVREEYLHTGDNATAVADGLAATARVITAAAAIMVAVFLAFVLGNQVFLKIIGLGLATAIFVDASLVRMVLVPSTMELLGDANWWLPRWLRTRLPELHVEGASDQALEAELDQLVGQEAPPTGQRG